MAGGTARAQIVEALDLDPDYNDADEYSFADLIEQVRRAGETRALHDGLVEAMFEPDEDPSDADILDKITTFIRERNDFAERLAAGIEPFVSRVADALGVGDDTQATGSFLVREITRLRTERDAFRTALDGAWAPLSKRARKLQVEDVLYDVESGRTWTIKRVAPDAFGVTLDVLAHHSGRLVRDYRIEHPDEPVTVLCPLVVKDGLLLLRNELGAQLVDADPNADEPEPTGEAS
jgi:hypothetical protein